MNYLAHLYLSGGNEGLMLGNFMADFLNGPQQGKHEPAIMEGIRLHHAIDAFTDRHPVVKQGYQRLKPIYGRYGAVIIDVFYDYLLAQNWEAFAEMPLKEFAQSVYQVLEANQDKLPPKAQYVLPHMVKHDWLSNYAGTYGISKALEGLSRRASFENKMDQAIQTLQHDFELFNEEFLCFFPEIIEKAQPFWERAIQLGDNKV